MRVDRTCRWAREALRAAAFLAAFPTAVLSDGQAPRLCRDWNVDLHPRVMADIDNDGEADIVGFGDAGVWTALGTGDGRFAAPHFVLDRFGLAQGWNPTRDVRVLADVNHDGMADIVGFGETGVAIALASGGGGFRRPSRFVNNFGAMQGWDASKHLRTLADINNDGVPDIVGFGNAGVWTALATGDGGFALPHFALDRFGIDQGWNPARDVRVLADVNHDGMADIVAFGETGVAVALASGDGGFRRPSKFVNNFGAMQGWDASKHVRTLADINNDGVPDIVGFGNAGVFTSLATGDGGFATPHFALDNFGSDQGWTPALHVRLMADLNRDGMADIVGFGDTGVWTARAQGDGTFAALVPALANFGRDQAWDPAKHVRVLADLNKDGVADIVGFGNAGVFTSLATGTGGFDPVGFGLPEMFSCVGRLDFNLEWARPIPMAFR